MQIINQPICQMKKTSLPARSAIAACLSLLISLFSFTILQAQTLSFPGANGFGRFAKGARAVQSREVYIVTNLNDNGAGSFREAVSQPGRIVVFAVGGIIRLSTDVVVSANVTIAGQTAPGDGIVLVNKRVTFTGASNTICRYLRVRLGATNNSGKDASGLANGNNIMLDHMSFSWGMDEVFSINWDNKNSAPDSITIQNSIIAQGLHRENHSAGGLIQTPDGGKISLLRNLYISNKTRNPKVKGINEFVNNVVYNWGNGNRLGDNMNYGWSGEAYIMGGSSGVSEVNIINNYFMGGPLTPPAEATPFSRGTGSFYLYGSGNYFDNNKNGVLDGILVPYNDTGYPGIAADGFKPQAFPYPAAAPSLTAEQAYQWIIDSVGASYPRRDQLDGLLINEVASRGTQGLYVYRETDIPLSNGGAGEVFNAPAPLDSDADGMPDAWEDANGLNKNYKPDALAFSASSPEYLNIEVYINSLINTAPADFIRPPGSVTLNASSFETPAAHSRISITWTDNSANEDHFVLERSEDNITWTDIDHPAANSTSYTDSIGLIPNKTYYYRLKAATTSDASSYSVPVSVKTPPLPTAPGAAAAPSPANGFQYAELLAGNITLKWTGSSNTESFAVYVGTSPSAISKLTDIPYSGTPSFLATGLSDFTTYYWRIDASNNRGVTEGELWSFRTTKAFPAGMVGHWSFDETDGRQVTDSSLYENHGVLGLDDDDQSIRVTGKVNNGIDFATASTNMYVVSVPHADQLHFDRNPFSLSFWMKAAPSLLPPDNNSSSYLLCKGSISRNATTGATGKRFDIEFKNKQLRFAIDDDNDANGGGKDELQADGIPFFNGEWVHVVVIRDTATRKLFLYRNGAFVKEQAVTKANSGIGEASALIIGNIGELEFLAATNQPAAYKGMLDEFKAFNYALTAAQILELYHTSPLPLPPYDPSPAQQSFLEGYSDSTVLRWKGGLKTTSYKLYTGTDAGNLSFVSDIALNDPSYLLTNLVPGTTYYWRVDALGPAGLTTGSVWSFTAVSPKGLVGHWKLDETTGTIAADNSNYHHNGTVTNIPEAVWATAKFGNGLQYKNPVNTGSVNVPHATHLLFDRNSFTVSLWVKLTKGSSNYNSASPAKDCYLIHKGQFTDPGGKWYGIQLKDSILTFAIDDASVKSNIDVSLKKAGAFNIFNDEWTNIIAIKDTATRQIKLIINGVQAGTKTYTSAGTLGKALPLLIGNSAENKPFHDIMDDVRLYNYALTPSEIAALLSGNPPVVITKNITVSLDSTGTVTIQPADVDNGSADDYGITGMQLSKTSFDCSNIGPNTVSLTVTDSHGNTATGNAIVTIAGAIPRPGITVTRSNNIYTGAGTNTVFLGYGAQQLNFYAKDSGNISSTFIWTPATALTNAIIPNPSFKPTQQGTYTYTVTATNNYGCKASTSVTAQVIDIRCGHNRDKVKVCFGPLELCLPPIAVPILLRIGFKLGDCDEPATGRNQSYITDNSLPSLPGKFMVFPNPASDKVTLLFELKKTGKYSLELYSTDGKLVKPVTRGQSTGIEAVEWNMSQYPPGLYFVKLVTETGVDVQRIIIKR